MLTEYRYIRVRLLGRDSADVGRLLRRVRVTVLAQEQNTVRSYASHECFVFFPLVFFKVNIIHFYSNAAHDHRALLLIHRPHVLSQG
jgi:hypothetical protein